MVQIRCVALFAAAGSAVFLAACQTPIKDDSTDALKRTVEAGIERELNLVPEGEQWRRATQPPAIVESELQDRIAELDQIGPQRLTPSSTLNLGPDLQGSPQSQVGVSLQRAIAAAVENNLTAQLARLQPAISQTQIIAAEAAFDASLFLNASYGDTTEQQVVPIINGIPLGASESVSRTWAFETGVQRRLETGGSFSISTDLTSFRDSSPNAQLTPDPAWTSGVRLGLSQPLLQGFGWDVNTATIRLARNQERQSIQQLRETLLELVFLTEQAYWDLVIARQDLLVRQWLVESGEEVRDVLARRRAFDTKQAQYSDAVATVEQRKARVLEARRQVRAASDRLKALMNDPDLSVESEILVDPVDWMVDTPINTNLREAVLTAVENRPELQVALLDIDSASIGVTVADNGRLPALDLTAQISFLGLDDDAGSSYSELFSGNFVDYLVGLTFAQPIGNRAPEAAFRESRLTRSGTVINYRRTLQNVVVEVKSALRDCLTNYELISANRSTRLAEAENLRTLLVEEQTLASLTPEFLNLKFQRQERLAAATSNEYAALASYNSAVAELYRSLGTGLVMNRIEFEVPEELPSG